MFRVEEGLPSRFWEEPRGENAGDEKGGGGATPRCWYLETARKDIDEKEVYMILREQGKSGKGDVYWEGEGEAGQNIAEDRGL